MKDSRAVLSVIVLVGVPIAPRSGSAQEQAPLRLTWDAPQSCPARAQVEDRVRTHLKLERWPLRASFQVVAAGRVSAQERSLVLDLEVRGKEVSSRRTLIDADCDVLANGAALLIAMAVAPALESQAGAAPETNANGSPQSVGSSEQPEGAGRASTAPGVAQTTTAVAAGTESHTPKAGAGTIAPARPAAPASAPERDSPVARESGGAAISPRFAVGADVSIASDLMPAGPALGAEIAGELRLRPWRFGLSLGITPARSDHLQSYPAAVLRTSALMLAAWPCYEWSLPPMSLGLCLYGEIGRVDAILRAIDEPQRSRSFWVAGGGGLSLGYEASRHLLAVLDWRVVRAANDLHFFIATPSGEVELHHTGPLCARLSLRLEWLL